jgi:hypothetical protein
LHLNPRCQPEKLENVGVGFAVLCPPDGEANGLCHLKIGFFTKNSGFAGENG